MVMVMDESVAKLYCPDPACTSMRMMMMMTLMMTMMVLMTIRTKQVTMKMLMMMDDG